MIEIPKGSENYGTNSINDRDRFTGWRIIRRRVISPGGVTLDALSTSRWGSIVDGAGLSNAPVPRNTDATEPGYQRHAPNSGPTNDNYWALIGLTYVDSFTPAFYWGGDDWSDDTQFFEVFYSLPSYYRTGWNTSGTRVEAILHLQQKEVWFWRPNNLPPLTMDCKLHYDFTQLNCWNGTTAVNDLSGFGNSGIVRIGNTAATPGWGQLAYSSASPWCGTIGMDDTYHVYVPSNIGITSNLTVEYIGKVASGNTSYIYNASGITLQNYNGSNTWASPGVFGTTNGTPTTNNHIVYCIGNQVTGTATYKIYELNNTGGGVNYQVLSSGGAPSTAFANIGSGLLVGNGGSNITGYDGDMNAFRLWAGQVTDDEALILANHSEGVVSFGDNF